jgi:protease PrsW
MVEFILAAIIAPALFWAGYFYYQDRFQPEPLLKLGTAYLLGWAAAFLCLKASGLLPLVGVAADPSALMMAGRRLPFLVYSVAVTGLLEETFKFLPFLLIIIRFREFDEPTDGLIYAGTVALGFASFENITQCAVLEGFERLGRAFASPLTQAMFSSIWGYAVGKARVEGRALVWPAAGGLALAALCHGVFNFLTTSPLLRLLSAVLILVVWIWVIIKLERAAKRATRDGGKSLPGEPDREA